MFLYSASYFPNKDAGEAKAETLESKQFQHTEVPPHIKHAIS